MNNSQEIQSMRLCGALTFWSASPTLKEALIFIKVDIHMLKHGQKCLCFSALATEIIVWAFYPMGHQFKTSRKWGIIMQSMLSMKYWQKRESFWRHCLKRNLQIYKHNGTLFITEEMCYTASFYCVDEMTSLKLTYNDIGWYSPIISIMVYCRAWNQPCIWLLRVTLSSLILCQKYNGNIQVHILLSFETICK